MNDYYDKDFKNKSWVEKEFSIKLTDETIVYAEYLHENYGGEAWVIFSKLGELYEVHASHDSTEGLSGQWNPESTSVDLIQARIERNGHCTFNIEKVKLALEEYKLDIVSFDIETLPDMKSLKELLSLDKLVEKSAFLKNQVQQIKTIQQQIIIKIKESIMNKSNDFTVRLPVELSDTVNTIKKYNKEPMEKYILQVFQDTQDKFNSKGYNVEFIVKSNELICSFQLEKKPNKTNKIH